MKPDWNSKVSQLLRDVNVKSSMLSIDMLSVTQKPKISSEFWSIRLRSGFSEELLFVGQIRAT